MVFQQSLLVPRFSDTLPSLVLPYNPQRTLLFLFLHHTVTSVANLCVGGGNILAVGSITLEGSFLTPLP